MVDAASDRGESRTTAVAWRGTSRYAVLGVLGRGGMGVVYEALDRQRQERVALKTLLNFDPAGLYRFKQEFRTLADVSHPNLVHLYELVAGEGDEVFFTMELVEGTDFLDHVRSEGVARSVRPETAIVTSIPEDRLKSGQRPSPSPARDAPLPNGPPSDLDRLRPALRQLVEGVRVLHRAGKLHRDLKPSNVRVTPEGRVVILDFGVATELGQLHDGSSDEDGIVGTATYMAPEQASGDPPVAASDWYSVGAMLYEALVGRPPFTGSAIEVLTAKTAITPPSPAECVPGIPEDLNDLCMALLAPEPEARPTAGEIARRLGGSPSDRAAPLAQQDAEAPLLVGREPHLRALWSAFAATVAGQAMTVRVRGLSGLGKSAVVHHFLDELERRGEALVLRGRAYERESVPYKAVDTVVDALSRHLLDRQKDEGGALELPPDTWTLAHLFPVLRRLPGLDGASQAPTGDPGMVRKRAFGVLRDLFGALTKQRRVVVFIDDVQWGDADSAALLVELMRPPDAPPVLIVTTHRSGEEDKSPFLADMKARWPEDAEVRDLEVGPLEFEDARRLALARIGSDDPLAQEAALGIAREAAGNPFLVEELARGVSAFHRVARPSLTLDDLVGERAARLPEEARRLLEVVAISGRPMPVAIVGAASGNENTAGQLVALLRAHRFVRAGLRDGREMVETIHDRIRETVVSRLPLAAAREHHAGLARVLEAAPDSNPEAIALHLLGAGDHERAAHYARGAAEQAIAKMAFAQAARLYEVILETLPSSSPEARALRRRMAEACEWAGHAEKAARAYLAAAEGAPPLERVDLERAAAHQLTAAGRIDESAAVFHRVLAAVGRAVPRSVFVTMVWVFIYRWVSAFFVARSKPEPRELAPEERVRLDALYWAQRGLTLVDPIPALYVKARFLIDAFRSRHPRYIVLAAAAEASTLASVGAPVSQRERTLFEVARRLSEENNDREGIAIYHITYGVGLYLRGKWRQSVERVDAATARLAAARRWPANGSVYAVYALTAQGDLREVRERTVRLLADADHRGDLYTSVNLRASHPVQAWLAADDVESARRHVREAMAQWSKTRFLVQHWQAMLSESEACLYLGDGAGAWKRVQADAKILRRSHLMHFGLVAIYTYYLRGRAALASLDTLPDDEQAARLAHAVRAETDLVRAEIDWAQPLAAIIASGIARARGDRAGAERSLRRAIELAEAADMALHAAAARYELGSLLGSEAGATLMDEAKEAMKARGVRVPEKFARILVPTMSRTTPGAT
jgi:serine/threonine protein kinase